MSRYWCTALTSPHLNPAANGTVFGVATVTVDFKARDCCVVVSADGYGVKRLRLHSIEEIQATYQVQHGRAGFDPVAADVANALKFAGRQLKEGRGARRG
ncbi:hypothetical protein AB9F29_16755 [Falsihalocynthiibacter sp. S25ZX9]|uniref:hypothetical protein n=1 Tax=Falsihalocynthiibacter sp. S25ZX9 TaxID=3240870 RepID=UPI0035102B12